MIVVDVGCAEQGDGSSVHALIERFHPRLLFGFDPHPSLDEGDSSLDGTLVVRRRAAAWTKTGTVPVRIMGACTGVATDTIRPYEKLEHVVCFDLCSFLSALPGSLVLKLDAEGSEYPILNAVAASGVDERLDLVLVEWHDGVYAHGLGGPRPKLNCPVEEWEHPPRGTPSGPTSRVVRSFA